MLFWLIPVVAVVPAVIWIVKEATAYYGFDIEDAVLAGIVAVLGSAAGIGVLALVMEVLPSNTSDQYTTPLKALGSDSSVSGRSYFLGGGYVEGSRVLSYIRENDNGSFTADQVKAKYAQVWEDEEENPSFTTVTYYKDYPWVWPGKWKHSYRWEFHVPEGSVSSEIEVKP